jgi:hypothetical protein
VSDIDFGNIQIPQMNFDYSRNMIDSIQRSQEESLKAVQEARDAKEAEELRRHNELLAALKEAGEKGATIVIGDNVNGIQIQQNSAGAQQKMNNSQTFNYEKASDVLMEISTYFDFPQFNQTFGNNTENVKNIIHNTIEALDKKEDERLIKKSLKVLKDLAIGAGGSLIGSGILALLGTIPF